MHKTDKLVVVDSGLKMPPIAFFVILAGLVLPEVETKVVVLLSFPHTANVRAHTNVGRALAAMGHEPYVLIPQFMVDAKLANVDGVKVIAYGEYLGNYEEVLLSMTVHKVWSGKGQSLRDMLNFVGIMKDTVRTILSDQSLRAKLEAVRPDMFVLTYTPPFRDIAILPYIYNSSFVFLSPFIDVNFNRIPFSPTSTPCPLAIVSKEYTFLDRLKTAACNMLFMAMDLLSGNDSMVAEFAPHRPEITANELANKAEVFLAESDHILDFPKPLLPNTKLIGGTAPTPGKPLKDPFKTFVEGSKSGIAVVTFGSSVVKIPVKIAKMMASAFEQQSLNVLWRVNYTSSNPSKIFTSEWLPQNDILAHSNTKLFVSHCGANGQYEALYHGVPMLCLPISGDQHYNARRSTIRGFGLDGHIMKVTASELVAMMKEITENATYSKNIKKADRKSVV